MVAFPAPSGELMGAVVSVPRPRRVLLVKGRMSRDMNVGMVKAIRAMRRVMKRVRGLRDGVFVVVMWYCWKVGLTQ